MSYPGQVQRREPRGLGRGTMGRAVGEGLKSYYRAKIEELEILSRDRQHNLRRLEAQRNELNTKGAPLLELTNSLRQPRLLLTSFFVHFPCFVNTAGDHFFTCMCFASRCRTLLLSARALDAAGLTCVRCLRSALVARGAAAAAGAGLICG